MSSERWIVRCWPFGEGEQENGPDPCGVPEEFPTFNAALLRAVEEIADWTQATIDPDNGDHPSPRDCAMEALNEITNAIFHHRQHEPLSRVVLNGVMNEVVTITREVR